MKAKPYTVRGKSKSETRNPVVVGASVFISSVTFFYTGRIVEIAGDWIVLESAARIFDTGRFADALKSGKLNEIEPYPGTVAVNRLGVVDVATWPHALPTDQK